MTSQRDNLIAEWLEANAALKAAKEREGIARTAVFKECFPNAQEGVNALQLGNGYSFKASYPFNYKLGDRAAVDAALAKFPTFSNEAAFVADRLVKFEPKLSVGEYRKLGDLMHGEKMKSAIDEVLTISPGSPQCELVIPK